MDWAKELGMRQQTTRARRALGTIAAVAVGASLLGAVTRPAAADHVPSPIVDDPGCAANALDRNDDGSSDAVTLPFTVNFLGIQYDSLFVNNNGNVTFESRLSAFTPFVLDASTPPIIAPFLADVDTRGSGSSVVTYGELLGAPALGGRDAFCVNWLDVGYYGTNDDKLNRFQLLLVDRSDRDAGDFDIYFNYDRILWETGDFSGGSDGFGGSSAGAGYSSGNGNALGFLELPCSRVNGACLDSNAATGLHRTSTTPPGHTPMTGRHIFPIESGGVVFTGEATGRVLDEGTNPVAGAWVQVCPVDGRRCRSLVQTAGDGSFTVGQLPPGDLELRVLPPGNLNPATVLVDDLGDGESRDLGDVTVTGPVAPPAGVVVDGRSTTPGGVPSVVVGSPFDVTVTEPPCGVGAVTYVITSATGEQVTGTFVEDPPGTYTADIVVPFTGPATVEIVEAGCVDTIEFNIYIDPSGNVLDENGDPIQGATVTLLYSSSPDGPFAPLPDGDTRMAPSNRTNPDLTDANGYFGWDVAAGFYRVRAEAPGCTTGLTPVLQVPPPHVNLVIVLDCGSGGGPGGGGGGGGGTQPPPTKAPETLEQCRRAEVPFPDVGAANVHAADIACAALLGILEGRTDGTFGGAESISRAQIATVLHRLVRAAGSELPPGPDRFADDDGSVHEGAINRLALAGLLSGTAPGQVSPSAPASRAQFTALLVRLYVALGGQPGPAPDAFDDDDGSVHEETMNVAAALGIVQGTGPRTGDPTSPVNRDQAASLLLNLLERALADGLATLAEPATA